jgi:hypothetical protein
MRMIVDAAVIRSVVLNGAPSHAAARLLGIPWPLAPGWYRVALDREVDVHPDELAGLQAKVAARRAANDAHKGRQPAPAAPPSQFGTAGPPRVPTPVAFAAPERCRGCNAVAAGGFAVEYDFGADVLIVRHRSGKVTTLPAAGLRD